MSAPGAELLRQDLLVGVSILVVTVYGEDDEGAVGSDGEAVFETCSGLGADVRMRRTSASDLATPDTLAGDAGLDALVIDGQALFAAVGLDGCLEGAWQATQAAVNGAFLNVVEGEPAGGRIVLLAPRPGAGPEADAARAGLENLARTLSIEWARYGITVVTIALGDHAAPGEAAALAAYLASPAGAYFSGCQLDLRGG